MCLVLLSLKTEDEGQAVITILTTLPENASHVYSICQIPLYRCETFIEIA